MSENGNHVLGDAHTLTAHKMRSVCVGRRAVQGDCCGQGCEREGGGMTAYFMEYRKGLL